MTTQLEIIDLTRSYTVEEFLNLEWPEDDDNDYELIGGQIVARQGETSGRHGDIVARIATELNIFAGPKAGPNRKGKVYAGSSTNLGNPKGKSFPKPDVCFVLKGNGPEEFEGPIPVAPDLVVEVNSPTDTEERKFEKLQAYQQASVKLIWSVHMLEKYVIVYQAGEPYPRLLTLQDELDGGEVLPGFTLPVKELFE